MLADPESKIIRAFGILNESVPKDNFVYGVPHPGTYILDEKGVVRAKYFEDDFRERFTAAQYFVAAVWRTLGSGAGHGGNAAPADFGDLRAMAKRRPGTRLALALEIELKPGMHVYAPGVARRLHPVEWRMAESKAWRAHDVPWPQPKMLHLHAINETVPVYEGKFRLTRDMTIGQKKDLSPLMAADRRIAVQGTFRYQACDDKECFRPQKIPLRWSFPLNPLDCQRAPAELQRK